MVLLLLSMLLSKFVDNSSSELSASCVTDI